MTRWARANNVHKNKPAEATPWSQLRAGGGGRGGGGRGGGRGGGHPGSSGSPVKQGGGQRDYLRGTQPGGSDIKKPNRKKKEYLDEDVNGFMEYLQQSGQRLPKGDRGGREDAQELREEVETALKKDRRREDRRVKRQNDKKSNMVSESKPCFLPSILSYLTLCPCSYHWVLFSPTFCLLLSSLSLSPSSDSSHCLLLSSSCALTAGSPVTVWPTVRRPTETRRWAEASATAAAPPNTKSRSAELKWTPLWVRTNTEAHSCFYDSCFNSALITLNCWFSQVITRTPSASSVVRLDTCHDPAQIILKDFMHKVQTDTHHFVKLLILHPCNWMFLCFVGGCCRVCGSVEHFQKDCPEHQAASESHCYILKLPHCRNDLPAVSVIASSSVWCSLPPLLCVYYRSLLSFQLTRWPSPGCPTIWALTMRTFTFRWRKPNPNRLKWWSSDSQRVLPSLCRSFIYRFQIRFTLWTLTNRLITADMQWSVSSDTFCLSLCISDKCPFNKVLPLYIYLQSDFILVLEQYLQFWIHCFRHSN